MPTWQSVLQRVIDDGACGEVRDPRAAPGPARARTATAQGRMADLEEALRVYPTRGRRLYKREKGLTKSRDDERALADRKRPYVRPNGRNTF